MGKVIKISPSVEPDWRNSDLMQSLIAKDAKRAEKAFARYKELKKIKSTLNTVKAPI